MGGVAGHMSHLVDNLDFTFGEIKNILRNVASAELDAVEKVDGQNLFFSWYAPTGKIRTARNKSDIKKGGMTPEEFSSKWKGHPAEDAFINGFAAIQRAVDRLDESRLAELFGENSERWVNAEVMYVNNPNIINYGGDYIVLHNMHEYDESGKLLGIITSGPFAELVNAVEDTEGELDRENWGIAGPQKVELANLIEGGHFDALVSDLDALGMSDSATLRDFAEERLRVGPIGDLPISVDKQEGLISLMVEKPNAPTLRELKKGEDKEIQSLYSKYGTKVNAKKAVAAALWPVEKAISDFAIEVLRGLKSFFVSDHDAEVKRMRDELESSIQDLRSYRGPDTEKMQALLRKNLAKLRSIEDVASTVEGIVFEYPPGSRVLYKLTGAFAMANQIIGRARRVKPTNLQNETLKIKKLLRNKLLTEATLTPRQLYKRPAAVEEYLRRITSNPPIPFELSPKYGGGTIIIPAAGNDALIDALEMYKIDPERSREAFSRAWAEGVYTSRGVKKAASILQKTREFGGEKAGKRTTKESLQIKQINDAILNQGGSVSLKLGVRGSEAANIVVCEQVTEKGKGGKDPKADAVLKTADGRIVGELSLKYANTPQGMSQWGGIKELYDANVDYVVEFIKDVKYLEETLGRLDKSYYREIDDPEVAKKICYGGGGWLYNVSAIIASKSRITISGNRLEADHVWIYPNIPDGDWYPTLWARFSSGRGGSTGGLKNVRLSLSPRGARVGEPLPVRPR